MHCSFPCFSSEFLRSLRGRAAGDREWAVEWHAALPSTQTRAKELGMAGTWRAVVTAARQTEGRGRRDRRWESPVGGLYFSLLYRPQLAAAHLPLLGLAAALAVETACRESAGVATELKWPNDVLKKERKICGILSEVVFHSAAFCVTGIGLNLTGAPSHELSGKAGSLFAPPPPPRRRRPSGGRSSWILRGVWSAWRKEAKPFFWRNIGKNVPPSAETSASRRTERRRSESVRGSATRGSFCSTWGERAAAFTLGT